MNLSLKPSPIETISFDGFDFFLKRDDLLHPDFSDNKARKFAYLLEHDFSGVDKIISFGSAQSNALYSLAVLAQIKGVGLDYYVDHIASFLAQNPAGNYAGAIARGAKITALELKRSQPQFVGGVEAFVEQQVVPQASNALYVPEGGRMAEAQVGLYQLADELIAWFEQQNFAQLKLMLPSGTGTTALFLQQRFVALECPIRVLTCACVGSADYLVTQFNQLSDDIGDHPEILSLPKKYHFAKLSPELYQLWLKLKQKTGVSFDLLYDPLGWLNLLAHMRQTDESIPVIYLHQGGVLGNETMENRYRRQSELKNR